LLETELAPEDTEEAVETLDALVRQVKDDVIQGLIKRLTDGL
jgi:hypothetical protein